MELFTIGFTQKSARQFFDILEKNKIKRLIDIRLKPDGQLAGFTKKEDLRFFCRRLLNCDYHHIPELAPTIEILRAYREDHNWEKYTKAFVLLMEKRRIPETLDRALFEETSCCLLCSEPSPQKCHRRLVAELIASKWSNFEIVHL